MLIKNVFEIITKRMYFEENNSHWPDTVEATACAVITNLGTYVIGTRTRWVIRVDRRFPHFNQLWQLENVINMDRHNNDIHPVCLFAISSILVIGFSLVKSMLVLLCYLCYITSSFVLWWVSLYCATFHGSCCLISISHCVSISQQVLCCGVSRFLVEHLTVITVLFPFCIASLCNIDGNRRQI